ncbi:peptide ABC transporter, permease protein [Desulfosarcina variabilis str. Montpellier]|uniref:ABC transporter permease n=1 Tax=Desulfosarcina variabilis TaxID=2300 RepID=UPI003AFAA28B
MQNDYLLSRGMSSLLALAVGITCSFCLLHAMPGTYIDHLIDTVPGGPFMAVDADLLGRQFDLDRPMIVRYIDYVADVFRGEWGISFAYARPVGQLIAEKLVWSITLLLPAKAFSLVIGVLLGSYSGWHTEKKRDFFLLFGALLVNAVPSYVWAILAILVFGYGLNLFPLGGFVGIGALTDGMGIMDLIHHAILPFITLTICAVPNTYYLVRNSLALAVDADYIVTARAAGIGEMRLLFRHCLPNALLPVVTLVPLQIAHLMTGSVFIESVFSWPGIGLLTYEAIQARDLPILQGVFLVFTAAVVVGNLLADLTYGRIDPRVQNGV